MQVTIRAAQIEDAPLLAAVQVETWRVAYRGLVPDLLLDSMDVGERETGWRQILAEGGETLVAESDGDILGYVSFGISRDDDARADVGEMFAIYVRPPSWGVGVGRLLHDAAVVGIAAAGSTEATLWVLDNNKQARNFYEHAGWFTDGHVKTEERPAATLAKVRYRRRVDIRL